MDVADLKINTIFDLCKFVSEQGCIDYLTSVRWKDGVVSPFDKKSHIYFCNKNRYKCKNTGLYFTVKTGTIFEDTKLPLRKWILGIWLVTSRKKQISSIQLAEDLKVTQKTGYYMLKKIKEEYIDRYYSFNIGLGNSMKRYAPEEIEVVLNTNLNAKEKALILERSVDAILRKERALNNATTKRCSICNKEKDLSDFHKNATKKDGYKESCKLCQNEYAKGYYKKNKKAIDEKNKKYQKENNYREVRRLKGIEYRKNNPEHLEGAKVKICPCCGVEKSFFDFYVDNYSKDGRRCYCKLCIITYEKENGSYIYEKRKASKEDKEQEEIERQAAEWEKKSPGYSKQYYIRNVKKIMKLIKKKDF